MAPTAGQNQAWHWLLALWGPSLAGGSIPADGHELRIFLGPSFTRQASRLLYGGYVAF